MDSSQLDRRSDVAVTEERPSLLGLMIEKHEAIEQAVSLIKKELSLENLAGSGVAEKEEVKKGEKKFEGLTDLLEDAKIQSAIKVVAGNDTQQIIGKALVALKSSESIEDKSKVFSDGIKKLQANISQADKSKLQTDPLFNLAINLVGLRQNRRG